MRLDMEAHQVRAEKSLDELSLVRADAERLGIRPGYVPEDGYPCVGSPLLHEFRQKCEVVVLSQQQRLLKILNFLQCRLGKSTVHRLVELPIRGTKHRTRMRQVA